MPELECSCEEIFGVDVHDKNEEFQKVLEHAGAKADLYSASIESTAFPSNYFDIVVAISALEFVRDIDVACKEIRRILSLMDF